MITHYLQSVKEAVENDAAAWGQDTPFGVLPRPLTANGYENAHRYRNDELQPVLCEGFVKDETEQSAVSDCFKKGFMASARAIKLYLRQKAPPSAYSTKKP